MVATTLGAAACFDDRLKKVLCFSKWAPLGADLQDFSRNVKTYR